MAHNPKKPVEMRLLRLTTVLRGRIVDGGRVLWTRMNTGFLNNCLHLHSMFSGLFYDPLNRSVVVTKWHSRPRDVNCDLEPHRRGGHNEIKTNDTGDSQNGNRLNKDSACTAPRREAGIDQQAVRSLS
jgi:hypothetical protein